MFSMARRPEEYDDHSMAAPTPAFDVHGKLFSFGFSNPLLLTLVPL